MTTTSQPKTTACPAWCNAHQLSHTADGRVDLDYHLRTVEQLVDGRAVEIYQEFDRPTTIDWGNDESSTDPEHVRRLGRALLEAADIMQSGSALSSPHDE